ncbi:DNA adenine methylase [Nocardia mexicana]|nr:Dam family site-specific DNA-(adenine-N6)-methyltransferase [Nocardia mexicana]
MPPLPSPSSSAGVRTNDHTDEPEVGPFLKWPGGKRWFVEMHSHLFRGRRFDRYIEPFLGAGSVYFHIKPERAVLGDLNEDLMTVYRGIQQDPQAIQLLLEKHHLNHNKEHYYEVRQRVPSLLADRAARIIYLNRTCFNGIYRVNQRGEFNVPIGNRTRVVRDTDNFPGVSELLAGAELRHGDFEPLVDEAQPGDLVFLDPPYTVRHNSNGFIKYNEQLFSWDDQERLAKAATRAAERGAHVIVTNANHDTVRKLYPTRAFRSRRVSRFSSISASSESRQHFEELIIISKQKR